MIIKDLDDSLFSILIDESRDISLKEQMIVVLQHIDNNGHIIECFLGIQHVSDDVLLIDFNWLLWLLQRRIIKLKMSSISFVAL